MPRCHAHLYWQACRQSGRGPRVVTGRGFSPPGCIRFSKPLSINVSTAYHYVWAPLKRYVSLMPYTLKQAAEATGKSKPTILRAIQKGTISASRDAHNEWQVEPAEL